MMPSDTPFNGASNDMVGGRARSAEQRNLLSYLRGQTETATDTAGREKAMVLRGDRTATWGCGRDDVRQRPRTALHRAARVLRARQLHPLHGHHQAMVTVDGQLDLADLAQTVEARFAPKVLKDTFPGLRTHDRYAAFASSLHTRLGIGANGDGGKALRLLVRIQSGLGHFAQRGAVGLSGQHGAGGEVRGNADHSRSVDALRAHGRGDRHLEHLAVVLRILQAQSGGSERPQGNASVTTAWGYTWTAEPSSAPSDTRTTRASPDNVTKSIPTTYWSPLTARPPRALESPRGPPGPGLSRSAKRAPSMTPEAP